MRLLRTYSDNALTFPRGVLAAAFLTFVMLVMHIVAVEAPVMASDEYAYFGSAKNSGAGAQLFDLDPGLQRVENKVYPLFYRLWESISAGNVALVGRVSNALLFVLGGLVLFAVFTRVFDRRSASVSTLLYLLMPSSFYSTTLLPEVEFQLTIYLVTGVLVAAGPRPRYASIGAAAVLCALSYLIKPHAAALIVACAAYWFATGILERDMSAVQRWRHAWARAIFFCVLTGLLIFAVSKLWPVATEADAGMLPQFYRTYLHRMIDGGFLLANFIGLLDYVGGHLWVWLVLATPGLVALAQACLGLLRRGGGEIVALDAMAERRAYLALFIVLMLVGFVMMVALFTTSAAMGNDFERYRLHGRYLVGLLPFLLAYGVWASSRASSRLVPLVAIGALVSFALVGPLRYKLFPWDYPEAFGFFVPTMQYWTFDGAFVWPIWWLPAIGTACWLLALRFSGTRWPFVAFTVVWMLASHAQMSRWLTFQSEHGRPTFAAARAITKFMGDVPAGSGLIATSDRYGQTSTLLMGLDSPQYVRAFGADAKLERTDLPAGVSWIITPRSMHVDVIGSAEVDFGDQRLFLLDGKYQWPLIGEKARWDGKPLAIGTGSRGEPFLLHGFNEAEEWGSWSKDAKAFVELPVRIHGPVVLSFFAWQLEGHPDFLLQVGLEDAIEAIGLGAEGRDYQVVLNPAEDGDRIMFESKVVHRPGESRGLGVALARLRIARAVAPQTGVPAE